MQHREHPSPDLVRRDIEDAWRLQSETARRRYEMAREQYRRLLDARPEGLTPRQDDPLALARRAESEAREEYRRILKIFTDLLLHGQTPKLQAGAMAGGGQN